MQDASRQRARRVAAMDGRHHFQVPGFVFYGFIRREDTGNTKWRRYVAM